MAEVAHPAEEARLAAEAAHSDEARRLSAAEISRLADEVAQSEHERLSALQAADQLESEQLAQQQAVAVSTSDTAGPASDEDPRASAQLQADVFAELSASAAAQVVVPVPEAVAEPVPASVLVQEPPPSTHHAQDTDTAALLRELSSLGLDDDPAPPASTRPAPPPRPVQPPKKRKGLFGR